MFDKLGVGVFWIARVQHKGELCLLSSEEWECFTCALFCVSVVLWGVIGCSAVVVYTVCIYLACLYVCICMCVCMCVYVCVCMYVCMVSSRYNNVLVCVVCVIGCVLWWFMCESVWTVVMQLCICLFQ